MNINAEFVLEALGKINDQTFDSPYRARMVVALIADIRHQLEVSNQETKDET